MTGPENTEKGLPESGQSSQDAVSYITKYLNEDTDPSRNLAGFHNTFMEEEAEQLMLQHLPKNITHHAAYPGSLKLELSCINMLSELMHAPLVPGNSGIGVSTCGSSEAIFLCVLASKRRWVDARRKAGNPCSTPNIVMHSTVHVAWKKAALFLDIEERYCYSSRESYTMNPSECIALVDENTVLVTAVMGSLYTGEYDDVGLLNDLLERHCQQHALNVFIHVDAASGGFVAPFVCPELVWDFRLSRICSINLSGHKCNLTYAAVGWALWRNADFLPKQLSFVINYCGSQQVSFAINFSKPAIYVIAQYYQLIRNGRIGYTELMTRLIDLADELSADIESIDMGRAFDLCSKKGRGSLPIVVFKLRPGHSFREYDVATRLKSCDWTVPAYTVLAGGVNVNLMRVVVRADLTADRKATFLTDLERVVQELKMETSAQASQT